MNNYPGKWFGAAVLAVTATAFSLPALAQDSAGASGARGTQSMREDDAGGQADGLPPEQHQGEVSFVSGGVGLDESRALRSAAARWPLELSFTGPGSDYLSDVAVSITDAGGREVLKTTSQGPYMLVRMKPGNYVVHARYKDNEQTRKVHIGAATHARAGFAWQQQ